MVKTNFIPFIKFIQRFSYCCCIYFHMHRPSQIPWSAEYIPFFFFSFLVKKSSSPASFPPVHLQFGNLLHRFHGVGCFTHESGWYRWGGGSNSLMHSFSSRSHPVHVELKKGGHTPKKANKWKRRKKRGTLETKCSSNSFWARENLIFFSVSGAARVYVSNP